MKRGAEMKPISEQITIKVSEKVVRPAVHTATRKRKRIEDVLSAWLEEIITELPVDELPDEDVLALADLKLTPKQEARLSDLLIRSREETLDAEEQRELEDLMYLYERGLLRKAQALRVAVQRRLRKPLQP